MSFAHSMDTYIFDFTSPAFSAAASAHCSLDVIIGIEGLSLMVTGKNGAIEVLKHKDFPNPGRDFNDAEISVRTAFGAEPLLSYDFAGVRCAFFNLNATLVPRRLFATESLASYFKLLLQSPEDFEFYYDHLPELDCYLAYAVEPMMARWCGQYFPHAKWSHLATPVLKNWQRAASPTDYDVFLNVRRQAAQIAVFDRQNLLLYNAFQFSKASDLLYFTLLAYDQFRLDPGDIRLSVTGSLTEDSEGFRLLYRYVRTIRFETPGLALPKGAGALPEHFWYDLGCLHASPNTDKPYPT